MYSFIYDVWFVKTYEGSKIDDIHPKQLSQGFYGLKRPKKGLYISGHHILHLVRSCITSKNNQKLLYWAHATDFKSFWAADNIKYQLNFLRERYFRITISKSQFCCNMQLSIIDKYLGDNPKLSVFIYKKILMGDKFSRKQTKKEVSNT